MSSVVKKKVPRPNRKKKYTKTVIVKVTDAFYSEIVKSAATMKISKSEVIRKILKNYFNI